MNAIMQTQTSNSPAVEVTYARLTVRTADLPAALRALVKMTGHRPTVVDLEVSVAPTMLRSTYSTKSLHTLGTQVSAEAKGYTGSDGEWNSYTEYTYTGPAARVTHLNGKKTSVTIAVGGMPALFVAELYRRFAYLSVENSPKTLNALAIALDVVL